MILYLNDKSEIHDVNSTEDLSLTPVYVDENNELFPFKGMSDEGICCYKVTVVDGIIIMFTPYVDSNVIPHIDQLGKHVQTVIPYMETKTAYIDDTEATFKGVPNGALTVYFDNPYTVERDGDRVTVKFEALNEVKTITISII